MKKRDRAVLDTYLQYTLEIDSDACIDSLVPSVRTLELSDINRLGQQVHDYIVNLLEGAQRETASADVNELLDEILEVERAERKNFSKMGDSAYDL